MSVLLFICIWLAARECNRTLPPRCRRVWPCQSTFFLWVASFSAGRSRMAPHHRYRLLHHQRISSDIFHQDVCRLVKEYRTPRDRKAEACRKCRGTWCRIWYRTTSSFCWTSGGLTWVSRARGSLIYMFKLNIPSLISKIINNSHVKVTSNNFHNHHSIKLVAKTRILHKEYFMILERVKVSVRLTLFQTTNERVTDTWSRTSNRSSWCSRNRNMSSCYYSSFSLLIIIFIKFF